MFDSLTVDIATINVIFFFLMQHAGHDFQKVEDIYCAQVRTVLNEVYHNIEIIVLDVSATLFF